MFLGRISLVASVFFLSIQVAGQKYVNRVYTEANGLASSTVYHAVQDTAGAIWFATRAGISRFDGSRWTSYSTNEGLLTSSYSNILVDEKGNIWALPYAGTLHVSLFKNDRWHTMFPKGDLGSLKQFSSFDIIYRDDTPVIAVGTLQDGLLINKNGKWHNYTTQEGLAGNQVTGVEFYQDKLYVSTNNGLSLITNGAINNDFYNRKELPSKNLLGLHIEPLEHDMDCRIWMVAENWLGYLQDDKLNVLTKGFNAYTDNKYFYLFIFPDAYDDVYFGNPFELYMYNNNDKKVESIGMINGLVTEGATSVFSDVEQNIWITGVRGVSKIPSKRFIMYNKDHGLLDNEVTSIVKIRPGFIVLGHYNGISLIKNGEINKFDFRGLKRNVIPDQRILDIEIDRDKNIWIAFSRNGIVKTDTNFNLTWYDHNNGLTGIVTSVIEDSQGMIWALANRKLHYLENGNFHRKVPHETLFCNVRKIFTDNNSLILASHDYGLVKVNDGKIISTQLSDNEHTNSVNAYFRDSIGTEWIGTWSGLYNIDDSLKLVLNKTIDIRRPVFLIIEDNDKHLWFGTDNGIYKWDGEKLHHHTHKDGISSHEINRDAGLIDASGNVWIGTSNGLTIYRKKYDYNINEISKPQTRIEYLIAGNDTLSVSNKLVLKSSSNDLIFGFHAISMIDEDQVYYSCKLDGYENEWNKEFRSYNYQYRYMKLPPGEYKFCIKARNALGIWGNIVCSKTIRIMKPYYWQWWFLILLLIIISSIFLLVFIFGVQQRYARRLQRLVAIRTKELKESENRLTELNITKDKFFGIIAHDLKSPFNSILGLSEVLLSNYMKLSDKEKLDILKNLQVVSHRSVNLLDNLLNWARIQNGSIPFEPEKFNITNLVRDNLILFDSSASKKEIELINLIERNIHVYADKNMINTIIRNLFSNAIKFTYSGGRVVIIAKEKTGEVEITVKDNGMGMSKQSIDKLFSIDEMITTKGTKEETGTGLGLILCKEFIEKNNGIIKVSSYKNTGTRVLFTLPVSHS